MMGESEAREAGRNPPSEDCSPHQAKSRVQGLWELRCALMFNWTRADGDGHSYAGTVIRERIGGDRDG